MQAQGIDPQARWQGDVVLIGGEVRFPVAMGPIGEGDRFEAVNKGEYVRRQCLAQFGDANRGTGGKRAEFHQGLQHVHQFSEGLLGQAFSPVDDALEYFVEQLIGHVAQHQLPQPGNERRYNQQRDIEDFRGHIDERIPQGPARLAVHLGGGHGLGARIVEDLIELLLVEVLPDVTFDRLDDKLKFWVVGRLLAPRCQAAAVLGRMPGDARHALAEVGEERATVLMGDKAAEKRLVILITQLPGQLLFESQWRGILLERMQRVVRHVSHQALSGTCALQVRGEQQDAAERCIHHHQVMALEGEVAEFQRTVSFQQPLDLLCVIGLDIAADPRQLQGGAQRGFLAGAHLVL